MSAPGAILSPLGYSDGTRPCPTSGSMLSSFSSFLLLFIAMDFSRRAKQPLNATDSPNSDTHSHMTLTWYLDVPPCNALCYPLPEKSKHEQCCLGKWHLPAREERQGATAQGDSELQGRPDLQYVPHLVLHCIHAHPTLLFTVRSLAASTALDMMTSPLDVTIFTRQLRRDLRLGALVFINSPRPRAAMLVCLTRQPPTCIHCGQHLTRGLWRPHLRKRNDIVVQMMVREDRLRYSISPAPGLWMYRKEHWVGEMGDPVRSPSSRSSPVALWLSAVWTDSDSSKISEKRRILTSVLHFICYRCLVFSTYHLAILLYIP